LMIKSLTGLEKEQLRFISQGWTLWCSEIRCYFSDWHLTAIGAIHSPSGPVGQDTDYYTVKFSMISPGIFLADSPDSITCTVLICLNFEIQDGSKSIPQFFYSIVKYIEW
jgi:hypothetical protein